MQLYEAPASDSRKKMREAKKAEIREKSGKNSTALLEIKTKTKKERRALRRRFAPFCSLDSFSNIHRPSDSYIAAAPSVTGALPPVMPYIAAGAVMNLADVGIPTIMPHAVPAVSAPIRMLHRRVPDGARVFQFERRFMPGSLRCGRRLAGARRHAEQDRPESQSRHKIYPPFHIEHRLSFLHNRGRGLKTNGVFLKKRLEFSGRDFFLGNMI